MNLRLVLSNELEQVALGLYEAGRSHTDVDVTRVIDWVEARLSQEVNGFDYLTFSRIARTGRR